MTADEIRDAADNIARRSADAQHIAERAVDPVTLQLVAEIVAGRSGSAPEPSIDATEEPPRGSSTDITIATARERGRVHVT